MHLSREKEIAAFQAQLRTQEVDAVDPSWAPRASRALREDFERFGHEDRFRLRAVDCRTDSCVADVEFPSYGAAQTSWGTVLHLPRTDNCATTVVLDHDPEDATAPYRSRVLYSRCVR